MVILILKMQMKRMGILYNLGNCYILTDREPWSLCIVQVSLSAHTLLHVLYVLNAHQAFWFCSFADKNMHTQIE